MSSIPSTLGDFSGKQKARRKGRVRRYLLIGLGFLVVGFLVWLLWFSNAFVVNQVHITGTSRVSSELVETTAQVPMGQQLISLETDPIAARVMTLPPVQKAEVSVSWPNMVEIRVTERTPVYQRRDGDSFFLVDTDGVQFQQSSTQDGALIPVITGSTDTRLLKDAATVVSSLSPELKGRVKQISAQSPDAIVLDLGDKAVVNWGSADRSGLKSQVATALLKVSATVYDVSAPENPITRR